MQPNSTAVPVKTSIIGCSPIVFVLIIAFAFLTLSASVTPLNNLIARYTLCPTASTAYFKEMSGGTVHQLGWKNDVSGKIVTLYCEYPGGLTEEVENDVVVMTGFGAAAGLGAIVGLIVYAVMAVRARLRPA